MTTTMVMTNSGATTTASVASITNCRMSAIRLEPRDGLGVRSPRQNLRPAAASKRSKSGEAQLVIHAPADIRQKPLPHRSEDELEQGDGRQTRPIKASVDMACDGHDLVDDDAEGKRRNEAEQVDEGQRHHRLGEQAPVRTKGFESKAPIPSGTASSHTYLNVERFPDDSLPVARK